MIQIASTVWLCMCVLLATETPHQYKLPGNITPGTRVLVGLVYSTIQSKRSATQPKLHLVFTDPTIRHSLAFSS